MAQNKDPKELTVGKLFTDNEERLKLTLISDQNNYEKQITDKEVHRPGLALAGFVDLFTFHRVQVCGNTEATYMNGISKSQLEKTLRKVFSFDIPCFIDTCEEKLPPLFVELANEYGIPVFKTPFPTTKLIHLLGDYLDAVFAPKAYIHGSLVDVYGIGVLIAGRSGIGKSEVALDLVARGHRLVADDVITVTRRAGGVLLGSVNEMLRFNMEIRGLGIIDIHSIFGIRGIRQSKKIEVQIELVDWDKSQKYERLGLDEMQVEILGESVPLVRLPIYPGKNISMIAEVIALNQLLKQYGYNAAQEFEDRLFGQAGAKLNKEEDYLGHKFE